MSSNTLKSCCVFQEGYVNPSQTIRDYFDGPIKWLRASDLNDAIVSETEKTLSQKGFNSAGKSAFLFKKDTIAISKSGTIGRLGILKDEMCGNRAVINIEVNKDKADLHYIFYLLKHKRKEIIRKAEGSIQKNLYVSSLETVTLNHLEKADQAKISSILFAIDSKIANNSRINKELESMSNLLFNYWFVQFDFPDADGKPYKSSGGKMVWNESLSREIPEGWEDKSLSEIVSVSNESINPFDFPDKDFRHYSIPAYDELSTYKIEKGREILSNKFLVSKTDILVSKLNPWFSRVIYCTDESDLISSTEFVVWRTKNMALKNYMYMIGREPSFVTYCTNSATGTSNSHKRVNPKVMMKFKVAYNESIAERFGEAIGATIKMYARNQIENNTLSELRDWLLTMLMNGQVKVE